MERKGMIDFVVEACGRKKHGSDLLVTAFYQALRSYRRSTACRPFPTLYFHSSEDPREKDYGGAWSALQDIPSLDSVALSQSSRTCASLDEISSYMDGVAQMPSQSLNLLYWILNFTYDLQLVENPKIELSKVLPHDTEWISEDDHFTVTITPDFVLQMVKTGSCKGEKLLSGFELAKNKFGTIYAYHGTSAENLHSILRCGLLNLSNTNLQQNGAIFGDGIYLSTDLKVALTFSKPSQGWRCSCLGENLKYVLICEIAKGDGVLFVTKKGKNPVKAKYISSSFDHGSYIVVQNSDLVKIRYVLVYVEPHLQKVNQEAILLTEVNKRRSVRVTGLGLRRHDICKLLILLYVGLLLVVSYLKSSGNGMHHRR